MRMNRWMQIALAIACIAGITLVQAQVKIGVTVSATGAAASLGIPEKNTVALLPKEIGGKRVEYIVLDDASDTNRAVQNARKLIDEEHVDAIVGSTITPNSLAMIDVVAQGKTPMISLAASAQIIAPMDAKRAWVFKTPQNDRLMADALANYMAKHGVKTVGFIGFADAYGDGWSNVFSAAAAANGIRIVANERYNRTDTSVTGQVLKTLAVHPDAVLIAGAGTPAALPAKTLKERGYPGRIYQTHGVANNDFLRVCGKDCDAQLLPAGPVLVADQLPDSNPAKRPALAYKAAYERAYGAAAVSTFGGHVWDAGLMLERAIPDALKNAQPGTQAFRDALRAALEDIRNLPVSHGVINTTPADHNGLDTRARVIVQIVGDKWKLQAD
ncbi:MULTISPECIES: ABC transporter substrate-binding protein [Burkholderia]|uniref:ABC transporter substrate-binding protein n=1 Tax=Burkholderia TaxID=32008 RepID=UPI000841E893|nr:MULTISPECIES: ABC transporter substrate-binding protein [unclassified Burkholderia]AOK28329.1 branched-chain amino acid ABC transporter substrate-binding protein [Burkholderia sp. Bp7605]